MHNDSIHCTTEGMVSLDTFLKESGLSNATGWRYRRRGWLTILNIAGRIYIERAEISRFLERARRGEFSRPPMRPQRQKANK